MSIQIHQIQLMATIAKEIDRQHPAAALYDAGYRKMNTGGFDEK
ncbi:hypothetical protein ACLPHD_12630 [Serratia odorifera]